MSDFVFSIAKGKVAYYAGLPAASDGLIVVPIEATGVESDSAMKMHANLSTLLAASSNEQTTMGRKTAASVTVTAEGAGAYTDTDFDDVVWDPASGNALAALVVCYAPVIGGADTTLIPLTKHDFVVTPNGLALTAAPASTGFFRAT